MKRALVSILTGIVLSRGAFAQDVDRLVEELGSHDPGTRERAMDLLRSKGGPVAPVLEKALWETRDPEVRSRIEQVLLPFRISIVRELVGGGEDGSLIFATADGKSRVMAGGRHRATRAHRFSWSPDGRFLAYAVGQNRLGLSDLYLFDVETATEKKIASGVPGPFRPAWSLDSEKVAYAMMRKDKDLDFCIFSLKAGSVERSKHRDHRMWSWTSDGAHFVERWFAFVGSEGPGASSAACQGFSEILLDPDFMELAQISGPIVTSADGRKLFYFGKLSNVVTLGSSTNWTNLPLQVLDRETRKRITLAAEVPGKEFEFFRNSLSVSPDGNQVAFLRCTEDKEELSLIDVETKRERRLGEGRSPAWSSDGSTLAFERKEGGTRIITLKSGLETTLEGMTSPSFSPISHRPEIETPSRDRK